MYLLVNEYENTTKYNLKKDSFYVIGRASPDNVPDIKLISRIAGRNHGFLKCFNNQWVYVDGNSKNGTFYNGVKIEQGINGSKTPVILNDGDVLSIDSNSQNSKDVVKITLIMAEETSDERTVLG